MTSVTKVFVKRTFEHHNPIMNDSAVTALHGELDSDTLRFFFPIGLFAIHRSA